MREKYESLGLGSTAYQAASVRSVLPRPKGPYFPRTERANEVNKILIMWLTYFLFHLSLAAGIEIVEPYPNNISPIEGTEGEVTCVAFDSDSNDTRPARIDFIRRNGFGEITNLTGPQSDPRLTFESRRECEYDMCT